MEFEELDEFNLDETLTFLRSKFVRKTQEGNGKDGPPGEAYIESLRKTSRSALAYSKRTHVKLFSLNYFVAVEAGKVIGASGSYHVDIDYFNSEWREKNRAVAKELAARKNYFMGWTAARNESDDEEFGGKRVGTALFKNCLLRAKKDADENKVEDPHWSICADRESEAFFIKIFDKDFFSENSLLLEEWVYDEEKIFRASISALLTRISAMEAERINANLASA